MHGGETMMKKERKKKHKHMFKSTTEQQRMNTPRRHVDVLCRCFGSSFCPY
jgi:hypothetical protein